MVDSTGAKPTKFNEINVQPSLETTKYAKGLKTSQNTARNRKILMTIRLIGLCGKANSGKNAVAEILNKNYGFDERAFAYPMKEACKAIFGWNDELLNGQDKETVDEFYGVSPRKALQTLGTEWGRNIINKDIWLKSMEKFIREHKLVVIADIRMDNEAQLIRDLGGLVIEVIRPGTKNVREHKSEEGVSAKLINASLHNCGTLKDLERSAIAILDLT